MERICHTLTKSWLQLVEIICPALTTSWLQLVERRLWPADLQEAERVQARQDRVGRHHCKVEDSVQVWQKFRGSTTLIFSALYWRSSPGRRRCLTRSSRISNFPPHDLSGADGTWAGFMSRWPWLWFHHFDDVDVECWWFYHHQHHDVDDADNAAAADDDDNVYYVADDFDSWGI